MDLCRIDKLHWTDRNKLGGLAVFLIADEELSAEFNFYLQGEDCLSVRLGRHDKNLRTFDLENYLKEHQLAIRKNIKPDIVRLRQERKRMMSGEE